MIKNTDANQFYLFIETASSLLYSLAFTAMSLYEFRVAGLSPLQLVLVGTTLELTVLLCEVPTGIVADVYSRRLSIIIGSCLIGAGFLLEGLVPLFATILLCQVLWGLGYTFTSGSRQAWLSDEIGKAPTGPFSTPINSVWAIAWLDAARHPGWQPAGQPADPCQRRPFHASGSRSLAGHARPASTRPRWSSAVPFSKCCGLSAWACGQLRQRPRLVTILGVGLFYGLYSEGFDRLWVKHLLSRFSLPALFGSSDIAFFGLLHAASVLFSILATTLVERHLDTSRPSRIARLMIGITAGIAAFLVFFTWSPWLVLALGFYLLITALRDLVGPLTNAWVNQRLHSDVHATVLSMTGQVDAVGQIAGGPLIGLIASLFSVPAAIAVSGPPLDSALPLIGAAGRKETGNKNSGISKILEFSLSAFHTCVFAHLHFGPGPGHLLSLLQEIGGYGFVSVGLAAAWTDACRDVAYGQAVMAAFKQDGNLSRRCLCLVTDETNHFFLPLNWVFHCDGVGSYTVITTSSASLVFSATTTWIGRWPRLPNIKPPGAGISAE